MRLTLHVRSVPLLVAFVIVAPTLAQAPPNDECSGALPLTELNGINPSPGASGNCYTMTGATLSAGWNSPPSCVGLAASADVWFSFVPANSGLYQIDTDTPGGFIPGTLTDTVLEIYAASGSPCTPSTPIACNDDGGTGTLSFATLTLAAGSTYYVRIQDHWTYSGGTFYVNVQFQPSAPPANDDCTGTMPSLSVGSNLLSTLGSTTSGGFNNPCLSLAYDVWATFTPAVTSCYRIDTENLGSPAATMSDTVLAVYTSCASPSLACDNDGGSGLLSRINVQLTGGLTYLIQVGDTSTAPAYRGTVWINIAQVGCLPNDECAGSITVAIGTNPAPPASGNVFSSSGASTSALWPGNCAVANIVKDVWFDITPPTSGVYQVDTDTPAGFSAGSIVDTVLEVYGGGCIPGVAIVCDDDSGAGFLSLLHVNMSVGTPYKLRVGAYSLADVNEGTFYLNLSLVGPPLTNDECANATVLVTGANPAPAASGSVFNNLAATTSAGYPAACALLINDVWFSFTPLVSDTYVFDTNTPCGFAPGTMVNSTLALYGPTACGAPGPALACDADSGVGGLSQLQLPLTAGTTYYLRVGTTSPGFQTFYVNVTQGAISSNDECATSIAVGLGTNPAPGASCVFFSNAIATPSAGWPSICATITNDVWFHFTAPSSGSYIIDTETPCGFGAGTADNTTLAIYDSSCNPAVPPLACDADGGSGNSSLIGTNLTGGNTYLIRVGTTSTAGAGTFYLNVNQGALSPPNESCATAIPVGVGANPSPAASCNTYRNDFAIDTLGLPGVCATIAKDVWFVFTPPVNGTYRIDTETPPTFAPGTNTNTTIAVYGSCGVGPALACDADSGVTGTGLMSVLTMPGLVGGTPIYIRVGSASTTVTGTFYLTITRMFSLAFSSPFGPGSLQFDIAGGPPGGSYFMPVSLTPGAFPNGWLFGLDIALQDLLNELTIGYPFFGALSGSGQATFGPIGGVPMGLPLYAVALGFSGGVIDFPVAITAPVAYVVP